MAQGTTHGPMRSRRPFFIPQRFDSSCVSLMRGCTADAPNQKKLFTLLDLCVSSLRRGHANLLCIVPILTDDPRRESENTEPKSRWTTGTQLRKTPSQPKLRIFPLSRCRAFVGHLSDICRAFVGHLSGICRAFVAHLSRICRAFGPS